jgi:hypothetical protein
MPLKSFLHRAMKIFPYQPRFLALLFFVFALQFHGFSCLAQSNTPLTNFPTFNNNIRAVAVSGTTIYVGGIFTQATNSPVNGGATVTRNNIAAIDATTGAILPWDPNLNNAVQDIFVNGTTVYVGGIFTTVNGGTTRNYLCALDASTGLATSWNPNVNGTVQDITVNGTTVYVGGNFTVVNGATSRNFVCALDASTGIATAWNPNLDNAVLSLAISGSNVYLGGAFTTVNGGTLRNRLCAIDIATGIATGWNPNIDNNVMTIGLDGAIVYVGGAFTTVNGGTIRNYICSLDATTGLANSWNPNMNNWVWALNLAGTNVYASGGFTTVNGGTARNQLCALDKSTGNTTAWNPNINGLVQDIAISGTKVYAGGNFTTARQRFAAFENPSSAYSGTTFPEAIANNGTITQTRDVTLTGDTWLPAGAFATPADFTATGVPAGLTLAINRISATVARISFTGTAAAHANANDATVTLNFTNAALTSNNAAGVTGLNPASLTLDFNDPAPTAAYSGTTFPEAIANNGTITQTRDITLTGDAWLPAGAFATPADFTVTGVPAGLTLAVNRISATVARISFTGTAVAHANANDATVTLNFTNAALTSNNAAGVTGLPTTAPSPKPAT